MTLMSVHYIGHEYDRMIVLFSMWDGGKEIPRAISSSAMDYLERVPSSAKPSSSAYAAASRHVRPASIERQNLKAIHGRRTAGYRFPDIGFAMSTIGARSNEILYDVRSYRFSSPSRNEDRVPR